MADGSAWLLGAGDPTGNTHALLPEAAANNGNLVVVFKTLKALNRGSAVLRLQYSKDLGITDPWTTITVPETSGSAGGVEFVITPSGDLNEVQATIPASPGGRVFMRLKGVLPEP